MSAEKDEPRASVFGVPDQEKVIDRIDTVSDDDLTSSFFGDSIAEVEDAATRMFDVGVRLIATDPVPDARAFASAPPSAAARPPLPAEPLTTSALLQDDAAARRAFILGGPSALG